MSLQTFNTVQVEHFIEVSLRSSSFKNFRRACFSNFSMANCITGVKVSFPDLHSNRLDNHETMQQYVDKRVQRFTAPQYYTDASTFKTHQVREYFSMIFTDFLFYVWNVLNEFTSMTYATSCLHNSLCSVVFTDRKQAIGIQTYGGIEPLTQKLHVFFYSSKRRQRRQIDIFPCSRFILRCYHHRPSSEIDHYSFYWNWFRQVDNDYRIRAQSIFLCTLLSRYSKNAFVVRLVLRRLRQICTSNDLENRSVGSSTSFWTSLKHTIRNHCRDLEHM